jgi:hypothetical protein
LDVGGAELTDRGYVKVNDRLETTAPGVWRSAMWLEARILPI